MNGRIWTPEEDEIMIKLYPNTSALSIASSLGRSKRSVYSRATTLNLKKTEEYLKSEQSGRIPKLSELGANYRFKKGDAPKNKGRKITEWMPDESINKCLATRFKKGQTPHNAKPEGDGAISIRKDKSGHPYKYIRISLGQWELLSRVIWEQYNGKIPHKHVIIFKDGDTMNCAIENLECISMADNMKRNTYHRFGKEIALAIQLRGVVNRQINKHIKRLNNEKQD